MNKVTYQLKEGERERLRGRKCIFKQEKHLLFKMSAGTNSRGNANEILGQCQYLSNYKPTPAPTQKNRLVLGKGRGIKKPNQTI